MELSDHEFNYAKLSVNVQLLHKRKDYESKVDTPEGITLV